MKVKLILVAGILLLVPAYADAGDVIITTSGEEVTATYTEPTTNLDGSPLKDLAFTSVFHDYGGLEILARPSIPATSPLGGGDISTKFVVPVPQGVEIDVNFWARAEDDNGNFSPKSNIATKEIDHLAPSAP